MLGFNFTSARRPFHPGAVLLLLIAFTLDGSGGLRAQSSETAADRTFLNQLKNTKWRLFGTTSVKHLKYDDSGEVSLLDANEKAVGSPRPITVVRPGIAHWDIDGDRQNWCFYSTRTQESVGAIVVGGSRLQIRGAPRRLPLGDEKAFVTSLNGLVWETEDKGSTFVWQDGSMSVSKADGTKDPDYTCKPVLPGVLMWAGADGRTCLYVFDADGGQAWFLYVDRMWVAVKDGALKSATGSPSAVAGLSSFEHDVLLGLEHCLHSGQKDLGYLAYGEIRQRLAKRKAAPAVLEAVHGRLGIK